MAKPSSQSSNKVPLENSFFDLTIEPSTAESWDQAAGQLPESITINGIHYKTSGLSSSVKKLLAIYLADVRIVGQQKEMLALAELGLRALASEIESKILEV